MAAEFIPVGSRKEEDVREAAVMASIQDETPEGRSVLELASEQGLQIDSSRYGEAEFIPFTADTRMSGMNIKGESYRKDLSML